MQKQSNIEVATVEHLYEIYPSMPRYANDPSQSEVVRVYDFILHRFQGFYSKSPTWFVKSGTSPILFGDTHSYSGYPYISFSSTQDIVIAICQTSSDQIRINNYQSALYGENVLSSKAKDWKFDYKKEGEEKFMHAFIRILGTIADQLNKTELGGMDILIYSGTVQDRFIGWKEAVYACFYTAVMTLLDKKRPISHNKIAKILQQIGSNEEQIIDQPQMLNYKPGFFSFHNTSGLKQIPLPENLHIIIAHSLTPLPKKLIQGKRFNLRRCQILIALEYLKNPAGTTKNFTSLKQLQQFIGCGTEQLLKEVEQNIPQGKISAEDIEQEADRSLIDILKQVPYANSVIDQNKQYYPKERAMFFLKEEVLMSKLTPQNIVESIRQSFKNQKQLLDIGSQQIDNLIEAASPWTVAHKIIGNGWGGNVLFLCQKAKSSKLIEELINNFYLSEQNKILLSDDLEQYIHLVQKPGTGLAILDPQSQIWY